MIKVYVKIAIATRIGSRRVEEARQKIQLRDTCIQHCSGGFGNFHPGNFCYANNCVSDNYQNISSNLYGIYKGLL